MEADQLDFQELRTRSPLKKRLGEYYTYSIRCARPSPPDRQTPDPRPQIALPGSAVLDCVPPVVARLDQRLDRGETGDRGVVASCRVPAVLAMLPPCPPQHFSSHPKSIDPPHRLLQATSAKFHCSDLDS